MDLFEAKRILKKNNYQLIKEAIGDKKVVLEFDITRSIVYNGKSSDPSERRSYHIFMSQRKKALELGDRTAASKDTDETKLGGAKYDRQKVSTAYKTSSIWLDPAAIKEYIASTYNLNAKEEHTQVEVVYEDFDGNPYYEHGVNHLFNSLLVGDSEPYVEMTMTRSYRITITGDKTAMDEFLVGGINADDLAQEIVDAGRTDMFKAELYSNSVNCEIANVTAKDEVPEDEYVEVGNIVYDNE